MNFDYCFSYCWILFCRKLFENFDPSSIALFTEKKILSLKLDGRLLLSEPKLRAVVENAKQILKVINLVIWSGKREEKLAII